MTILPSNHKTILNPGAQRELHESLNRATVESMAVPLRPYERRILRLLLQGKNAAAIAEALGLDVRYVSTVLGTIQRKLKMNLIQMVVHFTNIQRSADA